MALPKITFNDRYSERLCDRLAYHAFQLLVATTVAGLLWRLHVAVGVSLCAGGIACLWRAIRCGANDGLPPREAFHEGVRDSLPRILLFIGVFEALWPDHGTNVWRSFLPSIAALGVLGILVYFSRREHVAAGDITVRPVPRHAHGLECVTLALAGIGIAYAWEYGLRDFRVLATTAVLLVLAPVGFIRLFRGYWQRQVFTHSARIVVAANSVVWVFAMAALLLRTPMAYKWMVSLPPPRESATPVIAAPLPQFISTERDVDLPSSEVRLLVTATQFGDVEKAAELLKAGHSIVNERDELDFPPLYYAVRKGDVRMVQLLLSHGANPTMLVGREGVNVPIYAFAATRGMEEALRFQAR